MMQKKAVIWFTGLSGSGKTTIAKELLSFFKKKNFNSILIDADNTKYKVKTPGFFTNEDRIINQKLIIKKVKKFYEKNYIVIVSFITPFKKDREYIKSQFEKNFFIIYVNTPIEVCKNRDPKGIYKKVNRGLIPYFIGINVPYEPPESPDLTINTEFVHVQNSVEIIIDFLKDKKILNDNKNFKNS